MVDHIHPIDTRTNDELFHAALPRKDEDVTWLAIGELQHRGTRDIFEHANKLCTSSDLDERRVGVDVISQLGIPAPTFHEETVTILLSMLEGEQDPEVLHSIMVALGHRQDLRAIDPIRHFKQHPDERVREGVAFGLLEYEDERAIQALIELSSDQDTYYIRDWATFGLGTQIKADTLAIREALVARLADEEGIVRGEALIGLALRHDQRMLEPLFNELSTGWLKAPLSDEASRISGSLYPPLVQLRDDWGGDKANERYKQLEWAIEKCRPAQI